MASILTKATQAILLTLDKHQKASTVSTFQKTGQLTPDEFVQAGDYLVQNYPSWSWGAGEPGKARSHLPKDKQYLQTRDVPCLKQELVEWDDKAVPDEDGWFVAGDVAESSALDTLDEIGDGLDIVAGDADKGAESEDSLDELELDEMGDLEEMDYSSALVAEEDEAAVGADPAGNVVQTRTYDINITYDVHYATPRVWLFGYDHNHNPLKGAEWRSDFSPEHVDKTVTHESHPHHSYSCPSIHPCKHAEAMKKMMGMVVGATGGQLDVKYYMLVFLKFIQSIIPNIEYDYTGEFTIVQQSPDAAEEVAGKDA